jgi:hypothetical protein
LSYERHGPRSTARVPLPSRPIGQASQCLKLAHGIVEESQVDLDPTLGARLAGRPATAYPPGPPGAPDGSAGPDSLAAARREYRTYCLGNALGADAPKGFLTEVERILDSASPGSSDTTSKPKQRAR